MLYSFPLSRGVTFEFKGAEKSREHGEGNSEKGRKEGTKAEEAAGCKRLVSAEAKIGPAKGAIIHGRQSHQRTNRGQSEKCAGA